MFFPIKDINPTKRFSIVTFFIILINIIIFVFSLLSDTGFVNASRQFALIPVELNKGNLPDSNWINPYFSIITYMFIHGGILHLFFNMLFLWIFGNNIEDSMSRVKFFIFYIIVGIISGISFAVVNPDSQNFLVGASGAISGVLSAYLFLFPFARVYVLIIVFPMRMPAIIFLIIWFFFQISGYIGGEGNVAWITHISGFIAGAVLHRFFLKKRTF